MKAAEHYSIWLNINGERKLKVVHMTYPHAEMLAWKLYDAGADVSVREGYGGDVVWRGMQG